ncbi:MAG: hypothetical protein WA981_03690 [Glaciecola sp.]
MTPHAMQHAIEALCNGESMLCTVEDVYRRMMRDENTMLELFELLHGSDLEAAERKFMSEFIEAARDELTAAREAQV